MIQLLGYTALMLCGLGVLSAVALYLVASKFKVYEDPRIDEVEKMLPGANCGGCGAPGCRGLADALVNEEDISSLFCPVGGNATMLSIASFLGKAADEKEPEVAVVQCNGSCKNRPKRNLFDGASSCAIVSALYGGETDCTYGCLGKSDCVAACTFGAITMDETTELPVVDDNKCTACGACAKVCPKNIIRLRKKGSKGRRIYIACSNRDRGGVARKACATACIACTNCQKVCVFEAVTIEDNLAFIDDNKCSLCRKCSVECPTGGIVEANFPPRKVVESVTEAI